MLSENSNVLEGLQSAYNTKAHPKAKLEVTFAGNESHSHVCLFLEINIKTCTYQLCKRQLADINILYRPIVGASLVLLVSKCEISLLLTTIMFIF